MAAGDVVLTLHTWATPNGRKVSILLEELAVPYALRFVDIGRDEQFEPAFLALSPNNKIPAIVDDEAEGGPTLDLRERRDPHLPRRQIRTVSAGAWTGPVEGAGMALLAGRRPRTDAGLGGLLRQTRRAEGAARHRPLDRRGRSAAGCARASPRRFAPPCGDDYSIADIACFPWVDGATKMMGAVLAAQLANKPATERWLKAVGQRPAVQRGMAIQPPHLAPGSPGP